MVDSSHSDAAPALDSPIRRLRLLSRLGIALLLDLIDIARDHRHMVDTLLLGVIVQANVGAIASRTDFRTEGGEHQGPIPDEKRRPIALNAVAASLGLPFETVRRRVRNLAHQGLCRFEMGGVIVPSAILGLSRCDAMAMRACERLQSFFYEVFDLGLLPELPRPAVHLEPGARAPTVTIRLAAEYVLREVAGLLETVGGPIDGLIAFEIFRANTAHFPHHLRGGEGYAAEDMIEDSQRRPVSVAQVAARLGMPHETVRRRIVLLLRGGVCRRVRDGVIVPAEVFVRADVREAIFRSRANLHRLFAGLARFGVLELWDQMRPPSLESRPA